MEILDLSTRICYAVHSDQVAETCDACDRKEDLRALLIFEQKNRAPIRPREYGRIYALCTVAILN